MRPSRRAAGALAGLLLVLISPLIAQGASAVRSVAMVSRLPTASLQPQDSAVVANGSWTVYHHDNAHTGFDSSVPPASGASTGWVSPTLDGQVYGEPLIYNGLVYVATLQNTVYALNQSTGAVVWSKNLGAPQTSGWQCGNINPTGTLGTGVIDTAGQRIYVAPFLHQFLSYYLVGLDLATGNIALSTPVKPTGFDWTIQQQRGALAMSHDGTHVYVPFGGRAGDCGPYHGWVVGVPTGGTPADELYETPSTGEGVWAAGGVLVDDSTGNVFFATGNAIPCSGAVNSDSVIRTAATLGVATAFFQPQDWSSNWCGPDLDLGSASPVIISPSLMFSSGKYGQGFLVNPASLGGTDGQLFPAQSPYVGADVCHGINSDATFGAFAYAAPYVYLECNGGGLVGLHVDTGTPSFSPCDSTCASPSWHAGGSTTFGPPIVAGGVVWVVDTSGGGLHGFNTTTGAQVYQSAAFGVTHFSTPSEAGGQIFVSAGTVVRQFTMLGQACTSLAVSTSPPSPSSMGTTVTVTAQASGCPNPSPLYRFALMPPGASSYQQAQAYSTSPTFSWNTAGLVPGSYRFSVWARDANSSGLFGNSDGRWDTYNNDTTYSLTSCSSLSVSVGPPSPLEVGNTVTLTAHANGCSNPVYHFSLMAPGASSYVLVQDYSSSATFSWNTTGLVPGSYRFSVWARDANSSGFFGNGDGRWDTYNNNTTYSLTSCSSLSVSVGPPSPLEVGNTVTLTAHANGCSNPVYHFSLMAPGASSYVLVQDYSSSATFSWNTTGLVPGSFRFSVWARDANSSGFFGNGDGRWDTYNNDTTYSLTSCSSLSVTVSPSSPSVSGTTVTVTATAAGCSNPVYHFSLMAPGSSSYVLVQNYSSSATFTWNTTGLVPGTYRFSVWARDSTSSGAFGNSDGRWDTYNNNTTYTLN